MVATVVEMHLALSQPMGDSALYRPRSRARQNSPIAPNAVISLSRMRHEMRACWRSMEIPVNAVMTAVSLRTIAGRWARCLV
jgi:hypothetical protein